MPGDAPGNNGAGVGFRSGAEGESPVIPSPFALKLFARTPESISQNPRTREHGSVATMRRLLCTLAVLGLAGAFIARRASPHEGTRAEVSFPGQDPRTIEALERVQLEQELVRAERTAILYGELFAVQIMEGAE